jgi:hypothetical protein
VSAGAAVMMEAREERSALDRPPISVDDLMDAEGTSMTRRFGPTTSAAVLLAALVAVPTTTLGQTCAPDLNHDGVVDAADLGLLLLAWGKCSDGNGGGVPAVLDWTISSRVDAEPSQGSSVQNPGGTAVRIWDKNDNSTYWSDFAVNNLELLRGPTGSDDRLRIGITVDFSTMQGTDGPVNANFYINGHGVDGSDTPALVNETYSRWYYGDSNSGPGAACTNSTTIPELDLFETGSSSTIAGGLPTLMQITTHAGIGGGGQPGAFIGLGDTADYSVESQNITTSEPTLVVEGTNATHLGMNLDLPFRLVYEISSTRITLTATQGKVVSVVRYDPPEGVRDWTSYRWFSAVIGVNNSYYAGQYNGISVSTDHAAEYQSWLASEITFELSTDGGLTYQPCSSLETYSSGYHYEASECPVESRALPTTLP